MKRYLRGLICIFLTREVEYHFIFVGRLGFLSCQLPDQIFSVFLLDCFVCLICRNSLCSEYQSIVGYMHFKCGLPFYFLYAIFCCTKFSFNVGKLKVMKISSFF